MTWARQWVGLAALVVWVANAHAQVDARRSGFDAMSPATQALQRDDAQNPAMLWVKDGEALWNKKVGGSDKSCAACHGNASQSMRAVATRYPALDSATNKLMNLPQRINACRQNHQQAAPLPWEGQDLLALESYVALQSRGLPMGDAQQNPSTAMAARLQPFMQRGEALFNQRMGQLNLSCAQCHNALAGQRLGGNIIVQGHPTGYPIYRLEWQGLGSLQRRLRNCMTGVRAQPFAYGAQEMAELELFLAARARGMAWEAPAVRP
jgi:L-cysteine S-thiosulfotransferase